MRSITLLSCLSALAAVVSAGSIGCSGSSLNGGRGNIPAHNAVYKLTDDGPFYVCDAQLEACGEIPDNAESFTDDFVNCIADGQPDQKAAMWIFYDDNAKQYDWNINVQGVGTYFCANDNTDACNF